jgi:hypothetical protein
MLIFPATCRERLLKALARELAAVIFEVLKCC